MKERIAGMEEEEKNSSDYGIWVGNVFVERIRRQYEYSMMQRHFHSEYEIYYLISGERYYFIDQRTYPVSGGTLVFVNKGQIHKTSAVREAAHERLLIQLRDERISSLLEETEEKNLNAFFKKNSGALHLDGENRKAVEEILKKIEGEAKERRYGAEGMIQTLVAELLFCVSRILKGREEEEKIENVKSARHSKVQEVAGYISDHIQEPMSLESLAERFFC